MNHKNTIEKMKQMRLLGMADCYYQSTQNHLYEDYTTDQYLALLIDQECESRQQKKINNLIKSAGYKINASITNVDYTAHRGLNKNEFERLASLDFMTRKENIIFTGATGTGKSYLAQAIGYESCKRVFKTLYVNTSKFMEQVKVAKLEGSYAKFLDKIDKQQLLILDDFGLFEFDNTTRQALMDIVEAKYDKGSMIIASQIPVSNWHQLIGEGTIADAILDRVVNAAHRINLTGESLRKNRVKNLKK